MEHRGVCILLITILAAGSFPTGYVIAEGNGEEFNSAIAVESPYMETKKSSVPAMAMGSYVRKWWSDWIPRGSPENYPQNWPEFEFNWSLVIGSIIGVIGSVLGSVGGVGGGGFYLPMLNFVMGFDAKTSTALSKSMVMGASISSVCFNFRTKHPSETRSVIDYDFSMLFQPMILLGISIGVILNVILPEWLVTAFLVLLFSTLFLSTFKKATTMWELETKNRLDGLRSSATISGSSDESDRGEYIEISSVVLTSPGEVEEKITWQCFPPGKMALLILTWLIFLALQIGKVYVEDCGLWYWLATIAQLPVAFGVTLWGAFHQKGEQAELADAYDKEEAELVEEEIERKNKGLRRVLFSLFGLVAGVVGGLLGVGGGGIMGPAFLELGLPPQVSSATASFIMVFSSSLSVAEFYLMGRLPQDFALYFTITAILASALGQAVIKDIIHRTGKSSILVFILSTCLLCSGIILSIMGAERNYYQWESGANMGFQELCTAPQK